MAEIDNGVIPEVPASSFNFIFADWDASLRTRKMTMVVSAVGAAAVAVAGWLGVAAGSEINGLRERTLDMSDQVVVLANREREITGGISDLDTYAATRRAELYAVAGSDLDVAAAIDTVMQTVPGTITVQSIKFERGNDRSGSGLTRYVFTASGVGSTLSSPLEWRDQSLTVPSVVSPTISFSNGARSDIQTTVQGGLRDETVLPRLTEVEARVGPLRAAKPDTAEKPGPTTTAERG